MASLIHVLCCVSVCILLVSGKKVRSGRNGDTTVRVFYRAPRATFVYSVPVSALVDVTQHRAFRIVHTGPDQSKFRLRDNTLYVEQYPFIGGEIGQMFHVTIQARTMDMKDILIAEQRLTVIISEKNRFHPTFDDTSDIEVYKHIQTGQIIGQITTSDKDPQLYNQETKYKMKISPGQLLPFIIDPNTGTVKVMANLEDSPSKYSFRVTAINTGSPQLEKTSPFSIIIRDIAEPQNLRLEVYNKTSTEACWVPPQNTEVKKYELKLLKGSKVTRRIVKHQKKKSQCATFEIDQYIDYTLSVRVLNGAILGISAQLNFKVENGMCGTKSCPSSWCIITSHDSQCICDVNDRHANCDSIGQGHFTKTCSNKDCAVSDQTQCDCEHSSNVHMCEEMCISMKTKCANGGSIQFNKMGQVECLCAKGYYGSICQHFDPCADSPCQNGATCNNVSSTEYKCRCSNGYYGKHCEVFNPCTESSCKHGGLCKNITSTDYMCQCYYGHYGKTCEHHDPCFSSPCQNNGQCKNSSETEFTCKCQQGFLGNMCELYQPCNMDPCLNGGFCNSVDGHFFCQCPYPHFGRKCEHINLCQHLEPCGSHAITCHNMTDTDYKCICQLGWSGKNCSLFDPCFDSPCQHGGICRVESANTYTCSCQKGYYGENCEKTNLCSSNPCKNNAICRNTSNHEYQCVCAHGFYGEACENFDPCTTAPCLHDSKCQNITSTIYQCICPHEYFGDLCQYFNSCFENPCGHGECSVDKDGFYTCTCRSGYHGIHCQYFDPCLSNPCQHDGECSIDQYSYKCKCKEHYSGDICEHYDACSSNPCAKGTCRNLELGNYHCSCPHGTYGTHCRSKYPCSDDPCKNSAKCINVDRSTYRCDCVNGFYGLHCENLNPCYSNPCQNDGTCIHMMDATDTFICDCTKDHQGTLCKEDVPCDEELGKICYSGECEVLIDGRKTCNCHDGYYGYRCQAYDPCSKTDACNNVGHCTALDNDNYKCDCMDGFFGEDCEYHSPCVEDGICFNHATCVQGFSQNICHCAPGYTGQYCEQDIDECESSPCEDDRSCNNLPGRYVCNSPEVCPTETTNEAKGTYVWTQISRDTTISIECVKSPGKYASRYCMLQEDGSVKWGEPDTSECALKVENSSQAISALKPFKKPGMFKKVHQLNQAKELLNAVLKYALNRTAEAQNVSEDVMNVLDNMISAPVNIITESGVSKRILELMDEFMSNVKWMDKNVTFEKENFEIYAKQNSWNEHENGITYIPKGNADAKINLPAEVFTRDPSNERVKFIYFKTSKLFVNTDKDKPNEGEVHEVMSARVGRTQMINLKECIDFQLPNKNSPRHAKCVYWDEKGKFWATDGLKKMTHTGFTTTCCSSHLTYFAIAANPHSAMISMSEEHLYMSVTSNAGAGCALLTIVLVCTTYLIFRQLNVQSFGQVVIQLCLTLIVMNVSALIGWNRSQVHSDTLCLSMAVLSHFSVISSLLWAVILGKSVYTTVKLNTCYGGKAFLLKNSLVAYGIPTVCVATAAGLKKHLYLEDLDTCELTSTNRYIYCTVYLTPCCIAVLGMIIATVFIVKVKCCTPEDHQTQEKPVLNFWQVYGSVCVMFFLTLSWIFKYSAVITKKVDYTVYFGCAYFITNGLVGISMCLFFLFMKADACKAWTQCHFGRKHISNNNSSNRPVPDNGSYSLVSDKTDNPNKKVRSPVYHRQRIVHQTSQDDCTVPEGQYVSISTAEPINVNGGVRNKNSQYNTQYDHFDSLPRCSRI